MTSHGESELEVLRTVLSAPTAPFHEEQVAARVIAYLRAWDVPFNIDATGTIIARCRRGNHGRPLVLMAHMDHPALTLIAQGGPEHTAWTARLEGGVPARYFEQPVAVRLFPSAQGAPSAGIAARAHAQGSGAAPWDKRLQVHLDDPTQAALLQSGDFGIWDLPDYDLHDGMVHARAIDDLVGCAEMLLTLQRAAAEQWETDLYAVFTRAEEVGLVGAYAVLQSGAIPRSAVIVSLEASPVLPGVAHGEGPIIRVGDRRTTFNHDAEVLLRAGATRLGASLHQPPAATDPAPPEVKIQRQLMSGGSCEATTAVLLGYQATGLAIPLGNYHNMGPDARLAPEYINAQDFLTGVALLQESSRLVPELDSVQAAYRTANVPSAELLERLRAPFRVAGL